MLKILAVYKGRYGEEEFFSLQDTVEDCLSDLENITAEHTITVTDCRWFHANQIGVVAHTTYSFTDLTI